MTSWSPVQRSSTGCVSNCVSSSNLKMRRPRPDLGCSATKKNQHQLYTFRCNFMNGPFSVVPNMLIDILLAFDTRYSRWPPNMRFVSNTPLHSQYFHQSANFPLACRHTKLSCFCKCHQISHRLEAENGIHVAVALWYILSTDFFMVRQPLVGQASSLSRLHNHTQTHLIR
jgi:hypothetical protein